MENNEVIVKEKSNKGLKILLVILIIIVLALSGYLVYDKFIVKDETKITTTQKTDTQINKNKTVLKKDESKEIVYTIYTGKPSESFPVIYEGNAVTEIPKININSIYADKINKEILALMYKSYDYDGNVNDSLKCKDFCSLIRYKYFINSNILSLVIYQDGGTDPLNHEYYAYNIDIYTGEDVSNKDLVKSKNIDVNNFNTKLSNTFKDAYPFDKYYDGKESYEGEKDFATQMYNKTMDLTNCSIDNAMFLNENGELMVVVGVYYYAGGEGAIYSLVNMNQKQFIYYENYKI